MKFHKLKPYNKNVQILAMKSRYPQFKVKVKKNGYIEFKGILRVKPELPEYEILIIYRGSLSPIVKVLNPKLVDKPPHVYPPDNNLCLFHPDNFKWKKETLIASEIIEWSSAWIYFYEVWLQYGIWYGPEAKHNSINKIENEK